MPEVTTSKLTGGQDYDAVIVGASLAGCATAILLGRGRGAGGAGRAAPSDQGAYKKICSHYIQSSAVPTLERLGLLEPMIEAGAVRSGVAHPRPCRLDRAARRRHAPAGVNLRRERLDPLIRELAASTPGVDAARSDAPSRS